MPILSEVEIFYLSKKTRALNQNILKKKESF